MIFQFEHAGAMGKYLTVFLFLALFNVLSCQKNSESVNPIEESPCGSTELHLFTPSDTVGSMFYLTGVRLLPLDIEQRGDATYLYHRAVLRHTVRWWVQLEYKMVDSSEISAFSKPDKDPPIPPTVNPIRFNLSLCTLRFNRDIRYRTRTIPAGTNLLADLSVADTSLYFPISVGPVAIQDLIFNTGDFHFEPGCYQLSASWTTVKGEILQDTSRVYINLE